MTLIQNLIVDKAAINGRIILEIIKNRNAYDD